MARQSDIPKLGTIDCRKREIALPWPTALDGGLGAEGLTQDQRELSQVATELHGEAIVRLTNDSSPQLQRVLGRQDLEAGPDCEKAKPELPVRLRTSANAADQGACGGDVLNAPRCANLGRHRHNRHLHLVARRACPHSCSVGESIGQLELA